MHKQLMDKNKIMDFWPSDDWTPQQNTEATLRFIVYSSLLVFLILRDSRALIIGGLAFGYIYINIDNDREKDPEDYTSEPPPNPPPFPNPQPFPNSQPPPNTPLNTNNPYGNRLVSDMGTPNVPVAHNEEQLQSYWDSISPGLEQRGARINFHPVPNFLGHNLPLAAENCKTNPSLCDPNARGGGGQAARVRI